tara:strand:- start:881 stop:1030 length:150 start_codon:yes stop_codon:yes gene_type:complete
VLEGFGNWIPSLVIVTGETLGDGAGAGDGDGDLVIVMLFKRFLIPFIIR